MHQTVYHDVRKDPDTKQELILGLVTNCWQRWVCLYCKNDTSHSLQANCEAGSMTQNGPRTSALEQSGRALLEEQPPGPTPVLRSDTGHVMMS